MMIENCPDEVTRFNYIKKEHTGNNTLKRVSGALVGTPKNNAQKTKKNHEKKKVNQN